MTILQSNDDGFWQQMDSRPDYAAFLAHFDGFKNYRLISPEIWARWEEVNCKFESDAAFWLRMERQPDLQALIGRYGGYPRISPETWARWDEVKEMFQARRRQVE
jgi:hypothetical protein